MPTPPPPPAARHDLPASRPTPERAVGWRSWGVAALVLGLGVSPLLTGCPENACFLKVCNGADCRCSISSCSDGAAFDVQQNRCRCLRGYFDVAGQCLDQWHANAYCGRGYAWANGGCAELQCRPGDQLDVTTGGCVPKAQVAQQAGVAVGQGQKVGCPAGQKLVFDSGVAACVPASQACAKDETWNGTACQKTTTCATGSAWDPARGQCVAYAQGGGSSELTVDVATWAASNYGQNGGSGTPSFCSTFAKKPYGFGLQPGSSALVRVQIMMSFPGQEVSKGQMQTVSAYDANGAPVPAKGASDVQAGADTTFEALVAGGGRASVPSAQTMVKCVVTNSAKPQAVPESGGV